MSTIADLPGAWCYLYKPFPTLSADGTAWTARITFATSQANVIPFVTICAGVVESVPYSGGSVDRIVMLQHPLYNWLWSSAVSVEMFGEASAISTALQDLHSHARITVDFRSTNYPTSGSAPYATWEAQGAGIYTTIPGRKMKFPSGEVLGQDAGVFDGQTQYSLTLYQSPGLNDVFLDGYLNKLNSDTFKGKPPGSLLFNNWSGTFEVGSGGVMQWTKRILVTYQTHHWNQYYQMNGVLATATDPSGNPTFNSIAFGPLLGA